MLGTYGLVTLVLQNEGEKDGAPVGLKAEGSRDGGRREELSESEPAGGVQRLSLPAAALVGHSDQAGLQVDPCLCMG